MEGLGEEAEALLSDAAHLEKVLQWLVTDHREADEQGGGGGNLAALMAATRYPHDVICGGLRAGRRWPHAESHGVGGHNFVLPNAQLFKGLAKHLGAARLLPSLLPPLLALVSGGGKRDAQAAAAEALSGFVRGAGAWSVADQLTLWRAVEGPLTASLRACSVESLGDWQSALRFIAYQRDPRRLGWLLALLLRDARRAMVRASAEGGNETSLAQANTLRFLAPVLLELGWRAAPLAEALLRAPLLRAWSTHAYNQVREEAGNTLAYILHAFTPPPPRHAAVGAAMTAAIDGFLDHLVAAADADADASAAAAAAAADGAEATTPLEPPEGPARDRARARASASSAASSTA